jgi:pyridoxal phosphate phosphatase PHOSPHO2
VSDANTHFIEIITAHHSIRPHFAAVHTNGSVFTEHGLLQVTPHQPLEQPHACTLCPPNLCKGAVLDTLRSALCSNTASNSNSSSSSSNSSSASSDCRVIYVGDGGGDYCPVTRLLPTDLVLARYSDSRSYGLWSKIQASHQQQQQQKADTAVTATASSGATASAVVAEVKLWDTGHDLYEIFSQALQQ